MDFESLEKEVKEMIDKILSGDKSLNVLDVVKHIKKRYEDESG